MRNVKLARLDGKPEVFLAIQGEGRNIGTPTVFVRTSLCNLYCRWCDTAYTWNWEGTPFVHNFAPKYKKEEQIVELTPRQLANLIKDSVGVTKYVTFTGGEPLLQQKSLTIVANMLQKNPGYYFIEVETNGTITPTPEFDSLVNQYNVSLKLQSSGNKMEHREREDPITFFLMSPKAWFKFVIAGPDDLQEALGIINGYGIDNDKVYLMPEGFHKDELLDKTHWLIEVCKANGFHFTTRLHVLVYGGERRGV